MNWEIWVCWETEMCQETRAYQERQVYPGRGTQGNPCYRETPGVEAVADFLGSDRPPRVDRQRLHHRRSDLLLRPPGSKTRARPRQ